MKKIAWLIMWIAVLGILTLMSAGKTQAQTGVPQGRFETKDTERVKLYSQNQKHSNLKPFGAVSSNGGSESRYYIQPVLFVPADQAWTAEDRKAVNDTFTVLKQWYAGVLKQDTISYFFQAEGVKVHQAPEKTAYYRCPNHELNCSNYDGLWGNVQEELQRAGYPLWQTGRIYIILIKGGGGWAGSGCLPNCLVNWPEPGPAAEAGVAMLGDWALDGIAGRSNSECSAILGSACNKEPQQGAVGHELGHTLGLAHAQNQFGSIMYDWWNFPQVSLMSSPGNDEKAVLRNGSKFFLKLEIKLRGRGKPVLF